MKSVIYTYDMLPITIVDLPAWAVEHIRQFKYFVLAEKPSTNYSYNEEQCISEIMFKTAVIKAEILIRNDKEYIMLFTKDEEQALNVKCAFLPGQISEVRDRERLVYIQGLIT